MREHFLRRIIHAFGSISLLYYVIPSRHLVLTLAFSVVGIIEILRLKGKINLIGMRDYEKNRISGFFFFATGAAILLNFFPCQIAVPCILCASFADPIVGELKRKMRKEIAYVVMFVFSFVVFLIILDNSTMPPFTASMLGAASVVLGEIMGCRWIDDDLLIQILPATLLYPFHFL